MNNWIQLSPYGTFDHPQGKQTISNIDAQRCVIHTKTWAFRLGIKKIPVYIGHPDDPHFQDLPGHMNSHVYGYVKQLRSDNAGLWVKIAWKSAGRELIANRCYTYLSPRWLLSKTNVQSAYHPEALISIGLTQQPHLPVQPILPFPKENFHTLRSSQSRDEKLTILKFTQKVHQRMEETGESYPEAWHIIYKKQTTAY